MCPFSAKSRTFKKYIQEYYFETKFLWMLWMITTNHEHVASQQWMLLGKPLTLAEKGWHC